MEISEAKSAAGVNEWSIQYPGAGLQYAGADSVFWCFCQ
jgi:hypothetical protein